MELSDLANGQFLHLSRFQPDTFVQTRQWALPSGDKVVVSAPGIIVIEPAVQLIISSRARAALIFLPFNV